MAFPHTVWYRTDLFEEKGLEPPQTWEEMLEVAQELTEDLDGDGQIDRYGLAMSMQVSGFENNYAVQFGTNTNNAFLLDAEGVPIVTQDGNYERVVESLAYIKELKDCCMADGNLNWLQTDTRNVFLADEAAMMVSSVSFVYNINRDNPDMLDKVGTFPWPYNADNPDAESQNFWAAWGMGVMKTAKHPEEAKMFVEFFHDYQNQVWFFQNTVTGWLPPRADVAESDEYWGHENVAWAAPIVRDAGSYASTHGQVLAMELGPNPWAGIFYGRQLWAELWFNLIVEDMTPEETAKWLQAEMEEIIAEGL
jgi:multiple sugar transport system substrate-binding protein